MKKREVYYKLFLKIFIPCGLLRGLDGIIKYGFDLGLVFIIENIIIGGLFYGIVLSLLLGKIHIMYTDSVCLYDRKNKYSTTQHINFLIDNNTYNKLEEYIDEIKKVEYWEIIHESINLIEIKTPGEKIQIEMNEIDNENIKVSVESKPIKQNSIIDNGKNLFNVLTVENIFNNKICE